MIKHLLVDISAHGFGHVAQTATVVNELLDFNNNNIKVTIRSMAPEETLRERIRHPFELIPYQQDNGMIMYDAINVNEEKTMEWYTEFHSSYNERVSQAAYDLALLQPDLLFSNVPYLSLDAASKVVGIPSIALCSLNWADIFYSYCKEYDGSQKIYNEIIDAYCQVEQFLCPTPSMPMCNLQHKQRTIGVLALKGKYQPNTLQSIINNKYDPKIRFVLVSVGGVGIHNFPIETWPILKNVYWIFPDSALLSSTSTPTSPTSTSGIINHRRDDFIAQSTFEKNNIKYIDLVASCDLIITKTGYGTQTEAVINQIPTICINRADWPEHEALRAWQEQIGEVIFINWKDLRNTSHFSKIVSDMIHIKKQNKWSKETILPTGAKEAANILHSYLLDNDEVL